jgi:hypothetical protein
MYCPNCAVQNADDAKFCRGCGANLSLVPQALTGQLPQGRHGRHRHDPRSEGEPSLGNGITQTFMGLGFLTVAIVLWLTRMWWGVWMLIPAFIFMGRGIAGIVTAVQAQQSAAARGHIPAPPSPNTGPMPVQTPPELMAPPASVTESTTKLFDESNRQK